MCHHQKKFLGDPIDDFVLAQQYVAHSPTVIGETSRAIKIGDEDGTICFANTATEDQNIKAHVNLPSITEVFNLNAGIRGDGETWTLLFETMVYDKILEWRLPGVAEIIVAGNHRANP